ncbi:MAG: hypothetical protein HDT14_02490 [Oscillibacter sp.]|nr:hypothetical protein [Oscillibacter sp.]
MEKVRELLPKLLYIIGVLVVLLAPIRFASIFVMAARGYMLDVSDWLNYGAAAITTCGSGLLYMAAARVIELLERRDGDQP